MGHDVIEDKYARLYEQPFQLAQLGHDVLGVCLSYRNCVARDEQHSTAKGSLQWIGLSPGKSRLELFSYTYSLLKIVKKFKPNIIVGASDCLHVILGEWIAKKIGCKFAADLYDDYETFGLAKIPFIKHFYRNALREACVISCVSQSLSRHITNLVTKDTMVFALPSTINQSLFYPREQKSMRELLQLPDSFIIVGTAGGLTKEKGIETVYRAFEQIVEHSPNVLCVLAGPVDKHCPPPKHERIRYLGKLPHHRVAELFCALDVGVVYLRDTQYGQLSFPQKAYEMAACKIPMVVASIGDMKEIFSENYNELYLPDNHKHLASMVLKQIEEPHPTNVSIENWEAQAQKLVLAYRSHIEFMP